jgi:hypothetical protein
LAASGYMVPLISARSWSAERCCSLVPLGVLVLAPVIVDIVGFHVFLAPDGLPLALVVTALALFLAWVHREAYRPLLPTSVGPRTVMRTTASEPARSRA